MMILCLGFRLIDYSVLDQTLWWEKSFINVVQALSSNVNDWPGVQVGWLKLFARVRWEWQLGARVSDIEDGGQVDKESGGENGGWIWWSEGTCAGRWDFLLLTWELDLSWDFLCGLRDGVGWSALQWRIEEEDRLIECNDRRRELRLWGVGVW